MNPKSREEIERIKRTSPDKILSEFYRSTLSKDAQRVYTSVWFKAAFADVRVRSVTDEKLSVNSRVPIERIPAAQTELEAAGLMRITRYRFNAVYEILDTNAVASDPATDAALWQRYTNTL
jgi:hypothetical protein